MDKIDYEHLELLLGKLQQEIGNKRFFLSPSYWHDMAFIATYKENGQIDNQSMGLNLEDAVYKLNTLDAKE